MGCVDVLGDDLVALAAATRLARLGHRVTVVGSPRWRGPGTGATCLSPTAVEMGATLELPSAWRDLFAKSGRAMEAELLKAGIEIVEEAPAAHLGDGPPLLLPPERGAQIRRVREHFGPQVARDWTLVLDAADGVWQARRRAGVERPVTGRPEPLPDLALPQLPLVLADLADDPTRLAVGRIFGRWNLVGPDGPTSLQPLLDALDARARRVGVEWVEANPGVTPRPDADVIIDTRAPSTTRRRRLRRRPTPFRAPRTSLTSQPAVGAMPVAMSHTLEHTATGVVETWSWRQGDLVVTLCHDHTDPHPEPRLGTTMSNWRDRPPIVWERSGPAPTLMASAASHGGPEPWARILTGALAAYDVHEELTGQDVRPTNKAVGAAGRPRRSRP